MCLDVCGLAANLYRRNTPVIKVPHTHLVHSPLFSCYKRPFVHDRPRVPHLHPSGSVFWPPVCLSASAGILLRQVRQR